MIAILEISRLAQQTDCLGRMWRRTQLVRPTISDFFYVFFEKNNEIRREMSMRPLCSRFFSLSHVCNAAKSGNAGGAKKVSKLKVPRKSQSSNPASLAKQRKQGARTANSAHSAGISPKSRMALGEKMTEVALPELTIGASTAEILVGRVFRFPSSIHQKLETLQANHSTQHFAFFKTPASLLRPVSIALGRALEDDTMGSDKRRIILTGPGGSGKTLALFQAQTWAFQKGWIVLTIADSTPLVNNSTTYKWDERRAGYIQPTACSAFLRKNLEVNRQMLMEHQLSREWLFDRHVAPQSGNLAKLLEIGAVDEFVAHDVLDAFLQELSASNRPAVLFSLDNLSAISTLTQYRSADFKPIHAHDLILARTFLSYLSAEKSFARGAVITATSSLAPRAQSLDMALGLEGLDPFITVNERVQRSVANATVVNVEELTNVELRGLLHYYKEAQVYQGEITDNEVARIGALGGANIGQVWRASILAS